MQGLRSRRRSLGFLCLMLLEFLVGHRAIGFFLRGSYRSQVSVHHRHSTCNREQLGEDGTNHKTSIRVFRHRKHLSSKERDNY